MFYRCVLPPKIFCKIDGLALDGCDTTYTWGFRWPWGIWLNSSSCWMAVNSTLSRIYPRTTVGICCFSSGSWRKHRLAREMKVKMLYLLQPYKTLQLFKALCILSFWPVVRRKLTSSHKFPLCCILYCRTTPFGTLTLLCGWHQALVHERIIFSALQWCAVDPSPILVLFSNLFREVRQFSFLLPLFGVVDVYIDNPGGYAWFRDLEESLWDHHISQHLHRDVELQMFAAFDDKVNSSRRYGSRTPCLDGEACQRPANRSW